MLPIYSPGIRKPKNLTWRDIINPSRMLKKLFTTPLFYIFILALFLRIWNLELLPAGLHVDEAKAGWNAYSLWLTGKDDWLHAFPLHYDTFGDERPTGLFYSLVPSLAIFGLNVFAIRFVPALFGALAVVAIYFLAAELNNSNFKFQISNFAALMLAVSPWHTSLSRATSEGIISTTLILFGLVFILKLKNCFDIRNSILGIIFLTSSYFFYHTARLLVPAFIFAVLIYNFYLYKKISKYLLLIFCLFSLLTCAFIFSPTARSRLSQVSIFSDLGVRFELDRLPFEEGPNHVLLTRSLHNKAVVYSERFIQEYTKYFSSDFFISPQKAQPVRYQTASRGLLLYSEYFLLALGLILIFKKNYSLLPVILLLLAPLPAAITTEDSPNLHRALLMIPFISLIAAQGYYFLKSKSRIFYALFSIFLLLDFFQFSHMYLVHNSRRDAISLSRNTGVVSLVAQLTQLTNHYSQIILTNRPDNLYPWFSYLTRQDPRKINSLLSVNKNSEIRIGNITFSQLKCPSESIAHSREANILAIDAEGCPPKGGLTLVDSITRAGGGIPYTFWTYTK